MRMALPSPADRAPEHDAVPVFAGSVVVRHLAAGRLDAPIPPTRRAVFRAGVALRDGLNAGAGD